MYRERAMGVRQGRRGQSEGYPAIARGKGRSVL